MTLSSFQSIGLGNIIRWLLSRKITISSPWLLKYFWGNRRVSSKYPHLRPYPEYVTASIGLWIRWYFQEKRPEVIVVDPHRATKRIEDQIKDLREAPETKSLSEEEVNKLLSERESYRKAKNFAEADRIRDYLVSYGVTVKDGKLNE